MMDVLSLAVEVAENIELSAAQWSPVDAMSKLRLVRLVRHELQFRFADKLGQIPPAVRNEFNQSVPSIEFQVTSAVVELLW